MEAPQVSISITDLFTCSETVEQFSSNEYVYGKSVDYLLTDIHKFIKECNENHC